MGVVAKKRKSKPSGFGSKLKQFREQAELTQAELGARCDMAYQAIARLERGENEPSWPTVLKLAKALGVEPNDFMAEAN
jgi:transcriptional regulator with XRE-family HTH domain